MSSAGGDVIRIGFVGCGRATSQLHLPALRQLPAVEVTALADPDPAALARTGALAPAAKRCNDYRQLVELPDLDAVAVCVPVTSHAEIALAALAAGRHLFVEKPLALTVEDCDRLIAAAGAAGRTAMVGFNMRHHRLVREARALVRDGVLGPLELIRSVLTSDMVIPEWRKTRASGGGVLFELAVHHYDLWRFLTGAEVQEITAYASGERWEDESAAVSARLTSGALATAAFSQRTTQNNAIELCGRGGSLAVSLYRFDGLEHASLASVPGDVLGRLAALRRLLIQLPRGLAGLRRGGEWADCYRAEWSAFVAAVRAGTPPTATLADGRQALAIALAALESVTTGRSIRPASPVGSVA